MTEKKEAFKFEEYKEQALADLQAGKPLVGKGGILTPLNQRVFGNSVRGRDERPYGIMYRRPRG